MVKNLINEDGEVVVQLADGCSLRSGVYEGGTFTSGEYVRLCDSDGKEILYWDHQEWADDPVLVMGAIINSAAGLRKHENQRHNKSS
jgi:hypothetical protein